MRRMLATGLLVLVAGLLVPALAFAYSNRAPSDGGETVAMADDGDADAEGSGLPWVGLYLANINEKIAERLGVDRDEGVVVLKAVKDGPADEAGVEQGDIVLRVDDLDMAKVKDVADAVGASSPGDTLTFAVLRGAEEQDIDIVVGERPKPKTQKKGQAPGILRLLAPMAGNLMSAEITLADKEGNPVTLAYVAGTVAEIDGDAVTLSPKDGSDDVSLTLTDDVAVIKQGKKGASEDLAVDDELIAVWKDRELQAVLVAPYHAGKGHKAQARKRGAHGFPGVTGMLGMEGGHGARSDLGSIPQLQQRLDRLAIPESRLRELREWVPQLGGGSRGQERRFQFQAPRFAPDLGDLQRELDRLSERLEDVRAS